MILECSIDDCTRAVKSRGWCVAHYLDHDKLTGLVRGLLCRRCNTGLGYIEAGFHEPALQYLRGAEPSS